MPSNVSLPRALAMPTALGLVAWALFGPNRDVVRWADFPVGGPARVNGTVLQGPGWARTDLFFECVSSGELCHGWYFQPALSSAFEPSADGKVPLVIMASGLGAQIDFGMDNYAKAFAQAGLAAFLFDYRGFGSSGGSPRNLAHPGRHLADLRAALALAASEAGLAPGAGLAADAWGKADASRVALWGTSLAGGHVLALAGELGRRQSGDAGLLLGQAGPMMIRAVVAQSPHLDGRANRAKNASPPPAGRGLRGVLRLFRAALQDVARAALGLEPAYVPIVGPLGSVTNAPNHPRSFFGVLLLSAPRVSQKKKGLFLLG
mmetsp:Transcript_7261/g.16597  ORF Transcript_7261/g.16597 Transcript_7261/m.16597 type:complete len:319 (-) Transcript_7261:650-1606(-)